MFKIVARLSLLLVLFSISVYSIHASTSNDLPDLTLLNVTAGNPGSTSSDPLYPGEVATFAGSVMNQGDFLSEPSTGHYVFKDPNGNEFEPGGFSIEALRPSETQGWGFGGRIPVGSPPGVYTAAIVVDVNNNVTESNEQNNSASVQFFVSNPPEGALPDLLVTDLKIDSKGQNSSDPLFWVKL